MKDSEGLWLAVFGLIVAMVLFFGLISAINKAFKSGADVSVEKDNRVLTEQKRRMDEVEQQQKLLMESQEQRMKDFRNKMR